MASEDYNVADRTVESLTAGEKVQETVFDNPDTETQAAAATAGVSNAAYIDYEAALNAHQARSDIETLADRRAREYGDTFADGAFMRQNAYNADGTAATPPRPGTVHGDAPASS
jgi:hypothetical protein